MADSLLRVAMAASSNGYRAHIHDTAVSGAISAATFTAVPENSTDYDPLAMATIANPAKITVVQDGYYIVSARTSYLGNVDGTRMIGIIYANRQGAGFAEAIRGNDISGGGTSAVVMCSTGILKLLGNSAGAGADSVESVIWVSTGASTTTAVAALNTLELCFIGPA